MLGGVVGAWFHTIVYAPSLSGLSDTKMEDDRFKAGRTPPVPLYATLL